MTPGVKPKSGNSLCQELEITHQMMAEWPKSKKGPFRKNTKFWILYRDPGSPSENGFMEPKYLAEDVILHPNHHLKR